MQAMIKKSWLRRGDRSSTKSPQKSNSPLKSPSFNKNYRKNNFLCFNENSPLINPNLDLDEKI